AVGLAVNPDRAGEALLATGQRPPGLEAQVHHSRDGGRTWTAIADAALPARYERVPVVLFAEQRAWILTDRGEIFGTDASRQGWTLAGRVPAAINAASAGGSPCSV